MEKHKVDSDQDILQEYANKEYEHGWVSDFKEDRIPPGINEETIRLISEKKEEPEWMLEWRLKALKIWEGMEMPQWPNFKVPMPDFQEITYYSAPVFDEDKDNPKSLDEVDPELLKTFDKLGISIEEQKRLTGVAVDVVIDSVSVATTFKKELAELGIIFCSMSEAIQEHGDLVRKYLGTVVPANDNFYAALNSAVFSDGSFCYIPEGVRCPVELSTYFRINSAGSGQFERTLVVAHKDSYVSYLEGCTAPQRDENQLHAAVVELIAFDGAEIKYSTVQNWFPGDKDGNGGVFNFVTKRGVAHDNATISWAQVETGSAITWKYPSVVLRGDNSIGEFYSVALTNNFQIADTGTKMTHIGKNTKSRIVSKGISIGRSQNSYRGLVEIGKRAENAQNYSECDSLLLGDRCGAHTFPYIVNRNSSSSVEHEATTSKINDDIMFYFQQRGIDEEKAVEMIVNGFSKEVMDKMPMEFAVEARNLLAISLEGSVG